MNKRVLVPVLLVSGVLVASSALAQAAKGTNVVAAKDSVTTKLDGGKSYMTVGSRQACTTADSNHPLNGASGDCDGACVVDAAGKMTCMGSCTWVDRDGDIAFFTWDGTRDAGTWKLPGGTGKWQGSTGQGTWKAAGLMPGNFARNTWEGTFAMKK